MGFKGESTTAASSSSGPDDDSNHGEAYRSAGGVPVAAAPGVIVPPAAATAAATTAAAAAAAATTTPPAPVEGGRGVASRGEGGGWDEEAGGPSLRADEDPDVAAERAAVESAVAARRRRERAAAERGVRAQEAARPPIEMVGLRKVYPGGKVAVHDLTLAIHEDECFGLLGPNGAGKTSTIAMLTGLYPPSSGATSICGFDLSTQMGRIHEAMGVCPQFDILWPLLTVLEHLTFYLRLKGCPADEVKDRAQASATAVELGYAQDRLVSRISGGMKRRISLAISLLADPSVIFLDEPTTGLDPETKRAMWSLIDIAKAGRSIVLTTHSMEEADALCGRIGIMAYGQLRCLGPSLHLKRRFGDGFRVEVTHQDAGHAAAMAFLDSILHGGYTALREESASAGANTILLQLPTGSVRLSELFAAMEARPASAGIVHWSLRQPSLEEVFLKISRQAEAEQHGGDGGDGGGGGGDGGSTALAAGEGGGDAPPARLLGASNRVTQSPRLSPRPAPVHTRVDV